MIVKIKYVQLLYANMNIKIAIVLFMLIACSQVEDDKTKIGVVSVFSGAFARYGEYTRNAIELSMESMEHNIEPIYEDEKCDSKTTVTAVTKLLDVDDVRIILGPLCVDTFKAAKPIVFEKNAVMFLTGFGDDSTFEKDKNGINLASQIYSEDKALANFAYNKLGAKKVGILHIDSDFGSNHAVNFHKYFGELGGQITTVEKASMDETDFRTQILKIAETKPDAIFFEYDASSQGAGLKQFKELNTKVPIFGMYGSEQNKLVETAGEAAEGFYYSFPIDQTNLTKLQKDFINKYKDRYGQEPFVTSFFVFDGMLLLDQALKDCSVNNGTCIANFFKQTKNYSGVSGEISFNEDGSIERKFVIKQIKDGKYIKIN